MTLNIVQHKNILVRILDDVYTDPRLGSSLGFKGGTAAMLFYGLDRFSVDLDFDLLNKEKEDFVCERVGEILKEYGIVKKIDNKRYSFLFVLSYHNKLQDGQNVKVEINKRDFGSRYEMKKYLGIPMQVMVQEDMMAHKMVAMYERMGETNRDIFDVWFFLHNSWPVNPKIIESRTGMTYSTFLQVCIDMLEAFDNRTILSGLGELVDEKQKAWIKAHLKAKTIFLLRLALSGASEVNA